METWEFRPCQTCYLSDKIFRIQEPRQGARREVQSSPRHINIGCPTEDIEIVFVHIAEMATSEPEPQGRTGSAGFNESSSDAGDAVGSEDESSGREFDVDSDSDERISKKLASKRPRTNANQDREATLGYLLGVARRELWEAERDRDCYKRKYLRKKRLLTMERGEHRVHDGEAGSSGR